MIDQKFVIEIDDTSPKERREWIIDALNASIQWYANSEGLRNNDDQHVIVLLDLMHEISENSSISPSLR